MSQHANFSEVLSDLCGIREDAERTRQFLVGRGIHYQSQDARQLALEGIQCDVGACGNWINSLLGLKNLCMEHYGEQWESEYLRILGTRLSASIAEDLMLNYLRNTITTKIHFKIDNLFKNILRHLDALPNRGGFWHLSSGMLEQLGMSTTGAEKRTLTILANLRNSFHSNGMHTNADLRHEVRGLVFEFRRDERVECASWAHIVVAIHENLALLDRFFRSNLLSNVTDEIRDEFAGETE